MTARLTRLRDETDRGFTLIELLVVIIIIGILAAIAIPVFLNQRKKGVDGTLKADVKQMADVQETWIVDHPEEKGMAYDKVNEGDERGVFTYENGALVPEDEHGDFVESKGNWVKVTLRTTGGYCIEAWNEAASPEYSGFEVGDRMVYDSANGGLQPKGGTCSGSPVMP